jgi:hypothetical protein
MDAKKLKEVEDIYKDLKSKLDAGEISGEVMKSELKKIMIRDEDNRFWMIGSKTGGWYVYDGSVWTAGNPYDQKEPVTVAAAEAKPQERLEAKTQERLEPKAQERPEPRIGREDEKKGESEPVILCKFCQSRIQKHDVYCNFCGGQQKGNSKASARKIPEGQLLVKAVSLVSLIFFFGGLGLVIGVIFGATFGIFKIFGDWIFQFPMMLQEMQGKIQGGLFFGALGGIFGFLAFAVLAVISGLFFNLIAYVFGGLRFKIKS